MGVAAAVSILGTAYSINEQHKASRDQRKSQKIAQRRADESAARQRRAQVREARIRRAQILNASAAAGVQGSSGEVGSISSLQTQLGSNIGFLARQQALSQAITSRNISSSRHISRAATGQAISQVSSSFAGPAGYKQLGSNINNIFKLDK